MTETQEQTQTETQQPDTQAQPGPWFSSIEDETLRGYAESKGWESPGAAVKSYKSLESMRGVPEERLVAIPEDPSKMGAVWDKLGRPQDPDKYTNALGETYQDEMFSEAAKTAHELGLTDGQFKGMQEWLAKSTNAVNEQRVEQFNSEFETWKGSNQKGFETTQLMLKSAGVTAEEVQAAMNGSAAAFYSALSKVSSRMAEGSMVDPANSGGSPGALSAAAAKAKIDQKMADKDFVARLYHAEESVRRTAAAELRPFHKIVADSQSPSGGLDLAAENARLRAELARSRGV